MLETKVAEMLDKLSQQLGVASSKIWEWSMLQVKVEIFQNIIGFLLGMGLTFLVVKYAFWIKKNWKDLYNKDYEFWHLLLVVVMGVFVGIFDIYSVYGILELPQLIINPEYSAFQNIMNELGKLK